LKNLWRFIAFDLLTVHYEIDMKKTPICDVYIMKYRPQTFPI